MPTTGRCRSPCYLALLSRALPRQAAADFREFCRLNPRPCPLLEETAVGNPEPQQIAPGADLRTDLPRYRVWHHGELVDEPEDLRDSWNDDMVAFLLGCSFTFEYALLQSGIRLKYVDEGKNVAMYKTNIPLIPHGVFKGNMVVSMRWISPEQVKEVYEISAKYPDFHGSPVHSGDPRKIGISNIID